MDSPPLSQTNAAIDSIYENPATNNAVMDKAEEPVVVPPVATFTAVTGGSSTVLTEIASAHKLYVTEPTARFPDQYRCKQEADRIRRVTLP